MEASDAGAFRNTQRAVLLGCAGAVTLAAWLWLAADLRSPSSGHGIINWISGLRFSVLMWQA